MFFEGSEVSKFSDVIWEEVTQSKMTSLDNNKVEKHLLINSQISQSQKESSKCLHLEKKKSIFQNQKYNSKTKLSIDHLTNTAKNLLNILKNEFIQIKNSNLPRLFDKDSIEKNLEDVQTTLKLFAKILLDLKLNKKIFSDAKESKNLFSCQILKSDIMPKITSDKRILRRNSAPENIIVENNDLKFKRIIIKQKELDDLISNTVFINKKRKIKQKKKQKSLFIGCKKKPSKFSKSSKMKKYNSQNKTKLTLNENDRSNYSLCHDIWGFSKKNHLSKIGSKKLKNISENNEKENIVNNTPHMTDKSKVHFSLKRIGNAPSKSNWIEQMNSKKGKVSSSFIHGIQSNFAKLSGQRNLSINNGRIKPKSHYKKESLSSIKQNFKLTAESGCQKSDVNYYSNKLPRQKMNREILTCFQKSPKIKKQIINEFVINSPQSMNSMTLLSQKIFNTSEMKAFIAPKLTKNKTKIFSINSKIKLNTEKDKNNKKNLHLNYFWDDGAKKSVLGKISKTTKGANQPSISFLKMFSTKNKNEHHINSKAKKLWEKFKKKKQNNLKIKTTDIESENRDNFFYDDSKFDFYEDFNKKKIKKKKVKNSSKSIKNKKNKEKGIKKTKNSGKKIKNKIQKFDSSKIYYGSGEEFEPVIISTQPQEKIKSKIKKKIEIKKNF